MVWGGVGGVRGWPRGNPLEHTPSKEKGNGQHMVGTQRFMEALHSGTSYSYEVVLERVQCT